MVDWLSFALSLSALILSTLVAIVGLIISWINHRREYDPMIVLGMFRKGDETSDEIFRIKNLGRGQAFDINVVVFDEQLTMYHAIPIDLIPSLESDHIPGEFWRYPDKDYTDIYKLKNENEWLLFHITYRNEFGRKRQTYYHAELIPSWYTKITKSKFNKYKKKNR
ncbi:MAG: hypothetical protein ACTSSK_15675 [Candidatus Heimdallarchaeota archaeon]